MARLIFASNASLDGWTETADGELAWAPPDEDVFAATTEVMASVGTYLYGRRMYETMAVWETDPSLGAQSERYAAFASAWSAADKVVHSTTLTSLPTARSRLVTELDLDAVRAMKETSARDLLIGGPTLAAQALDAGLVDECLLWVWPIVLGGRKPALSPSSRLDLELVDERRFDNGVLQLRYRPLT